MTTIDMTLALSILGVVWIVVIVVGCFLAASGMAVYLVCLFVVWLCTAPHEHLTAEEQRRCEGR